MLATHLLRMASPYERTGYYEVPVHFLACTEVGRFDYWSHEANGHRSSAAAYIHSTVNINSGMVLSAEGTRKMLVENFGLEIFRW